MKANKFVAVALTALTLVGLNACKDKDKEPSKEGEETELALDQTSLTLEAGKTATLTATVEAPWESSDAEVATVKGEGKTATVTAVKEGSAVITAKTAGGQAKTCVVKVTAAGGEGGGGTSSSVKGSQFWPIIMDGVTLEANKSKMVASFQPNDVDQFLYIWDQTYEGGTATGKNAMGNTEGYTALVVTSVGWAGCGFFLNDQSEGIKAAKALKDAIVAAPDDYFLHLAIKSTDKGNHCFYFLGVENGTKFVLGTTSVYDGPVLEDFARDGSWAEFDIPMSKYASALAQAAIGSDVNVFVALTEGVQGLQLNLDAVYFYKK
ncbi:MAG: Ig domain-containing protein [Paludibacteraceae bacterium]|nr:Ig domain-containing protein [Paludibacteraceae bacterium]